MKGFMMRGTKLALLVLVVASIMGGAGCLGACEGTSGILGTHYCYDDFSSAECDDYDSEGVNDASWNFHPGETCWDLGY